MISWLVQKYDFWRNKVICFIGIDEYIVLEIFGVVNHHFLLFTNEATTPSHMICSNVTV